MSLGPIPAPFVTDALILAVTAVVRATTANRLVQRRLVVTVLLVALSVVVRLGLIFGHLQPDVMDQGRSVEVLLEALAAIHLLVLVTVNPLRVDRVSEHFPTIVQDAIVVLLFAVVAVVVLGEKVFAMSAVGAVVVGFALQDTLGNAFAGFAIQIEKPFRVGQWIRVGDFEGRVTEVTWRATKLRTKADTFVVLPNNLVSKEAIVNYSEPVIPVLLAVDVGATYSKPPNEVKAAILEALGNAPLALGNPPPDVMLMDFASSSITYRARFWVQDYGRDLVALDQVRTAIYYSFRRHDIEIPFPMQVEFEREEPSGRPDQTTAAFLDAIGLVPVFASLDEALRRELADVAAERLYGKGEIVVRQGAPGGSMFVVAAGELRVAIEPNDTEVARYAAGSFFGEMSLLTGKPRTATVSAVTDCCLMELTTEAFRHFVTEQPAVLERITAAVLQREEELARTRASASSSLGTDTPTTFLQKVRKFLKIG